jgi:hypothetical protein
MLQTTDANIIYNVDVPHKYYHLLHLQMIRGSDVINVRVFCRFIFINSKSNTLSAMLHSTITEFSVSKFKMNDLSYVKKFAIWNANKYYYIAYVLDTTYYVEIINVFVLHIKNT